MIDPYAQPEWYDLLHSSGTARDAAALLRVARRFVEADGVRGVWLECGCGTGRYGFALLKRGVWRFVGVDLHPAMVAHARRRAREEGVGSRMRVVLGDMRTLRGVTAGFGRGAGFDVAFCLDNSIRHLPSDAAMVEHLCAVRRVLSPKGVYIVGIGLMPEGGYGPSEEVAHARRRGVTVRVLANFLPPEAGALGRAARIERCFTHMSVSTPSGESAYLARYALRTWTPEQWMRALKAGRMEEIGVVDDRARDLDAPRTAYAFRVLRAREEKR